MGTFDKNPILESIETLCGSAVPKVSFSKMCVDLGLSKSLKTKLKDNPQKTINGETAQKIADYFGVSVDRVLGSDQKEKSPTPDGVGLSEADLKHLRAFHAADEETKTAITMLLKKFEKGESL